MIQVREEMDRREETDFFFRLTTYNKIGLNYHRVILGFKEPVSRLRVGDI